MDKLIVEAYDRIERLAREAGGAKAGPKKEARTVPKPSADVVNKLRIVQTDQSIACGQNDPNDWFISWTLADARLLLAYIDSLTEPEG